MPSDAPDDARVAIFGGSFNPPHVGHLLAVAYVVACADVDRVLVVPCFQHPFAKELASFDDRLEMCRRAFAPLARVDVSDVESRLGGDSITARTLEHLHEAHPAWRMRLIIGSDVAGELDRWTRPNVVRTLAPPLVLGRVGSVMASAESPWPAVLPAISSSEVRSRIARGDRIDSFVPRDVALYIEARRLYRA